MRRSFYHYLLTLRGSKNQMENQLAQVVALDSQFPKQSENYHEISLYLEMEANYLHNMSVFDELWEKYMENNS